MNESLPWAVTAALLLALLITALLGRRRRADARAEVQRVAEENERSAARLQRDHQERLRAVVHRHEAELEASRTALETTRDEAQRSRRRLAKAWKYEAVSHRLIGEACASAGLSGLLATNIVFVPPESRTGRRFFAQIDHLLLTRHGALIIEAKYWKGVVFDGVRPGTVHPSYGVLVREDALPESFAVHIAPSTASKWTVTTHLESRVPAVQVRMQAARFREHLAERGLPTPWFGTAVLYSHPDVRTSALAWQGTGSTRTRILTGAKELTAALPDLARRSSTPMSDEALAELAAFLTDSGAHVERVGPGAP